MKQIIIRMIVTITMCALMSVIRFMSFAVLSRLFQIHAESIWMLRLILASLLSPLLYRFLDKQTARWTISRNHKSHRPSNRLISLVSPNCSFAVDRNGFTRRVRART